jgi:hypothetical protein
MEVLWLLEDVNQAINCDLWKVIGDSVLQVDIRNPDGVLVVKRIKMDEIVPYGDLP